MSERYIQLSGVVKSETRDGKAVIYYFTVTKAHASIPRSQIFNGENVRVDDRCLSILRSYFSKGGNAALLPKGTKL